jgi:hypothetical protein
VSPVEQEPTAFEPKILPKKASVLADNCGSLLSLSDTDWKTSARKFGQLMLKPFMRYEDSAQQRGIFPKKPGYHMVKTYRFAKDSYYRVA